MTGALCGGVQGFWVRTHIFITTNGEIEGKRKRAEAGEKGEKSTRGRACPRFFITQTPPPFLPRRFLSLLTVCSLSEHWKHVPGFG